MRAALTRYRVMAWVVGVVLATLVVVAMPLKYIAHVGEGIIGVGWMVHGYLFMAYVATTVDLAWRAKWRLGFTALVCLAGTIPFLSFVAEHQVTRRTRAQLAAQSVTGTA